MAFESLLPTTIREVEYVDPTLLIRGLNWSLTASCAWRWVAQNGEVVSPATTNFEDQIWDLIGASIASIEWRGPEALGLDPIFTLKGGGLLELFSDSAFDTWVLHTPTIVLVGPLRAGPEKPVVRRPGLS